MVLCFSVGQSEWFESYIAAAAQMSLFFPNSKQHASGATEY